MKCKQEKITPNKAAILLKKNPKNRDIDGAHVTYLAKQMTDGEWQDNGQTIVISDTDSLVDGQHRLMAIIESGITLMLLVVRGVEDEVIHSIDTGKARGLSDVFRLEGHASTNQKAAFTKSLHQWKTKTYHYQHGGSSHKKAANLSLDGYYNLYKKHEKKVEDILLRSNSNKSLFFISRNDLSMAVFLLERVYKEKKVQEFLSFIENGGDYAKSPSHFLINFIQRRKRSNKGLDLRYRKEDFYIVMHCFEEWLEGKEMSKIDLPALIKDAPRFYPNYVVK